MGHYDPFHDSGDAKCHLAGVAVHIQAEEAQPDGEGKAWERIQAVDGSVDARQQVCVIC